MLLTDWETANGRRLASCANCGETFKTVKQSLCLRCMKEAEGQSVREVQDPEMPCTNRGAVIRQVPCGCGQRGKMADVHTCTIHGECVLRRAKAGDGLRCCLTCNDRQPESLPQDAPGV